MTPQKAKHYPTVTRVISWDVISRGSKSSDWSEKKRVKQKAKKPVFLSRGADGVVTYLPSTLTGEKTYQHYFRIGSFSSRSTWTRT